jgi:hypothetical protein
MGKQSKTGKLQKRSSVGSRVLIVLAVLGAVFVGLLVFLTFSSVSGSEFCPNTFAYRRFSYLRVPFSKWRITATSLTPNAGNTSSDVLKHLKTLAQPTVWHVSKATQYRSEIFPANVLVGSLAQRNADGADYWGAWSVAHNDRAVVLWPLVQEAAYHELYFAIPEILDRAEQAPNVDQMELLVLQSIASAIPKRIATLDPSQNTEEIQTIIDWFSSASIRTKSESILAEIRKLQEETRGLRPVPK